MFGRYGYVVTKQDWHTIKKTCPKEYKELLTEKSCGYCYYYSRLVALFLKDAELMYCSINGNEGPTCHSVIVKNHCVYCTNSRSHFDYNEYVDIMHVKIYKMFSAEEYQKETFFDDIREDLVQWCTENGVYCTPQ